MSLFEEIVYFLFSDAIVAGTDDMDFFFLAGFYWFCIAIQALIFVSYLIDTLCFVIGCYRYHCYPFGRDEYKEPFIASCSCPIVFFCSILSNQYYMHIKEYVCLNGPLFSVAIWTGFLFCAIVRHRMYYQIVWRDSISKMITSVMRKINTIRESLLKIEGTWKGIPPKIQATIFLIGIFIFIATNYSVFNIITLFIFGIVVTVNYICKALHSCKCLLGCWFMYGFFFSVGATNVATMLDVAIQFPEIFYIIAVLPFVITWIFLALLADDDVAKLAGNIMNTITTILLLIINVVYIHVTTLPDASSFTIWLSTGLQQLSMLCLLPIVAAGYLSVLFKDIQIYWRKKYM